MTNIRAILLMVLCLASGWLGCMWWHGLLIPVATATATAQKNVNTAVATTRRIDAADAKASEAAERVRVVKETVYVDKACKPGAGAVSDAAADGLLQALEADAAGPAGVR